LCRHNIKKDEWLLDVSGLRDQTKINDNQTVASFYQDGGKAENKVAPYTPIKLVEGSVIEWRPPPQHRSERFSRNLKFMVVADADDGVEEEEEEEEEAEVVVVDDEVIPDVVDEEEEEGEIEELGAKSQLMLLQERQDRAEKSGQVVSLLDTPEKIKEHTVEREDESVIAVPYDEEEEEEAPAAVPTVIDEGIPVVVDVEKAVVVPVIDVPSFEEIQRAIGFSPLNDTNNSVPHDEDLMGWHSPEAPRPNRRSIYDPIQIN
jgi:hypothetical protein